MVQNNYVPIKHTPNIWIIKEKLSNGSFQRNSQLESKQIELMNVMLTRWKERYIKYHSQTNEEMPTQPQRTPNQHFDYDAEEDSEVKNHCKKTNKNQLWNFNKLTLDVMATLHIKFGYVIVWGWTQYLRKTVSLFRYLF